MMKARNYISYLKEEVCIEYHPMSGEDTKNKVLKEMTLMLAAGGVKVATWVSRSGVLKGRLPEVP